MVIQSLSLFFLFFYFKFLEGMSPFYRASDTSVLNSWLGAPSQVLLSV